MKQISPKDICSVQTRFSQSSEKNLGLTNNIVEKLIKEGINIDVERSKKIVSIYSVSEGIYWGISDEKYNLSHWKGGMPHYSSDLSYGFISRAEFKLKEALEVFQININNMKTGADLGAAPGGWTKVLAEKGIDVISIDPSYLNREILKKSNVTYYHMLVERYLELHESTKFDIIVNDMKMDVKKSINIINKFYEKIHENGIVIMTFKLPHEISYKRICEYLTMFNGFEVVGCRQLFHNRSEITVVVKKKSTCRNSTVRDINKKTNVKKKNNLSKKLQKKEMRKNRFNI